VTKPPTRKQRADHMAELLADVAAQSLKDEQAKAAPVEICLLLTKEQLQAFARFLERGAGGGSTWATDDPAERAEIEGAIWSIGQQFQAALRAGKGNP